MTTMYPPYPEDARLTELERQLPPPPASIALPRGLVPEHEELPVWLRVGLTVCALLLAIIGIAGLFLPGLQGIVTILAAIALLSLVSSTADRFLRWVLRPWPKLLEKVEEAREKSRHWLVHLAERPARRRGCVPPGSPGAGTR